MSQRFELLGFEKWRPQPAMDRETGRRVLLPQHRFGDFLATASIRAMARRVRELDDPRCAKIVCIDPFAVLAPPEQKPSATVTECAHAALELVDLIVKLRGEGIVVSPEFDWAWAERHEGKLMPVVIAPARAPSFGHRFRQVPHSWITGVQSWLAQRLGDRKLDRTARKLRKALEKKHQDHERAVSAFFRVLQPHLGATDPTAIADAARVAITRPPRLDFDLAIELGEARHATMIEEGRQQWDADLVCWPLAGAYHHRGCVAWEQGDHDSAVRDVDRALELDPHPRYFTTRALFAEASSDADAWKFHDAAFLQFVAPTTQRVLGAEPPEVRRRDECRSVLARASYRYRVRDDTAGAIEDLRFVKSRWPELGDDPLAARVETFLDRLTKLSATRA